MYPITSGLATGIFYGDIVFIDANGVIQRIATVGSAGAVFPVGTIGVFQGCSYTDANQGFLQNQNWPAGQVAADAQAYVVDDPAVRFQVQCTAAAAQTTLLSNCPIVLNAGNVATGNSTFSLNIAGAAAGAGLGLKIIGFVDSVDSTVGDAFTDVIVKFNPSSHAMLTGTGL
tara:strand:+ start:8134 stop:8649 length:516 start_codon:yes stop_codon:yes gene_type:complete